MKIHENQWKFMKFHDFTPAWLYNYGRPAPPAALSKSPKGETWAQLAPKHVRVCIRASEYSQKRPRAIPHRQLWNTFRSVFHIVSFFFCVPFDRQNQYIFLHSMTIFWMVYLCGYCELVGLPQHSSDVFCHKESISDRFTGVWTLYRSTSVGESHHNATT